MSLAHRRILTFALLAMGTAAVIVISASPVPFGWMRWLLVAMATAVSLLPAVHQRAFPLLERLRTPTSSGRASAAVAIALIASLYFLATALLQGRDLFPKTYDDQAYLLQMRLLSTGRLWLPPHPLGDFFDSVHVIIEPVYAVAYFPGAALMYVPTIWLGWPTWLLPVIAAGACVGLVYRIVTELVDGLAGVLAALIMISLSWFRLLSVLLMAQVPALLLGLLMVWAFLRWQKSSRLQQRGGAWLALIGALAGWMVITRPVDAIAYTVPVGIAILVDLARTRASVNRWAITAGLILAAAAPFLALQLTFNRGVTGSFAQTPFGYYIQRDQPQTGMGFVTFDASVRPRSVVPQKQALYDEFIAPKVKRHTPGSLAGNWQREYARLTIDTTLPARPLLVLLPLGLLALAADRRRLVLAATLPLFLGLYALYTFYLEHYAVLIAPAVALLVVLALPALEAAWPRWRALIVTAFTTFVVTGCATMLPEVDRLLGTPGGKPVTDEPFASSLMRVLRVDVKQASDIPGKAVLLIRWGPGPLGGKLSEVAVYNTDTAWPDDARIIYANDLGPERNDEIFQYYAQRDPERIFYLFDRTQLDIEGGQPFHRLGTAAELAGSGNQP